PAGPTPPTPHRACPPPPPPRACRRAPRGRRSGPGSCPARVHGVDVGRGRAVEESAVAVVDPGHAPRQPARHLVVDRVKAVRDLLGRYPLPPLAAAEDRPPPA